MILFGKILWMAALIWLSMTDLVYMKLPYPGLLLFSLSGIIRVLPGYLNPSGSTFFRIGMTFVTVLMIGCLSAFACRKKQMGKGDLIVLMIIGLVYTIDQILVIFSLGFLLAGLTALLIIWTRQGERLPLVPFLGIGCLLVDILG